MSSSLLIITTNPEILQKEDISKQMLVHLPEKKITSIYNGSQNLDKKFYYNMQDVLIMKIQLIQSYSTFSILK